MRVLFVLKWRPSPYEDGSVDWGDACGDLTKPLSSGLWNSAKFVADMLEHAGIDTKVVHVRDANEIHREQVRFRATHVVVEAFWVAPAKFDELHRVSPHVQFIVRNHSETPFLAHEGVAFGWMLEYLKRPNVAVAPNAQRMLDETRFLARRLFPTWTGADLDRRVPILPNYYRAPRYAHERPACAKAHVDVGCFGAIRPLKNQMEQALAAMRFAERIGKPLHFHVNARRLEQGGSPVLHNLRGLFAHYPQNRLVEHPWAAHDEFKALVATMDIVAQVSFSETFSIVAADAVTQGIPVVGSKEIPWLPPLAQADPVDSEDIAEVMRRLYLLKQSQPGFTAGLDGLRRYNEASKAHWLGYLMRHSEHHPAWPF